VTLLVMLVVAGVLSVIVVSTVVGRQSDDKERDAATQLALARAKEALISYAVTYMDSHPNDVPGYLPCPDKGVGSLREGAANGSCGSGYTSAINLGDNQLGRLPWYTLDIEPLRDGYGECLWYAVSATYKNSPEPALLNWDSIGRFRIAGPNGTTLVGATTDADLAVAVIIAPGAAHGGQTRGVGPPATPICGGNYQASNYLDALESGGTVIDNANPVNTTAPMWRFIQGPRQNDFNDRLAYITPREIWDAVVRRRDLQNQFLDLTQQVALCLASYPAAVAGERRLPWGVPLAQLSFSFPEDYRDAVNTKFGHTPLYVDQSDTNTGVGSPYHKLLRSLNANTGALPNPDPPNDGRCSSVTWTLKTDAWWKHWKDHLFYAIADGFTPSDPTPSNCIGTCLRVNSAGSYAAIVLFAGRANASQQRYSEPLKSIIANYLDSPENTDVDVDYESTAWNSFDDDVLYCIDRSTLVTPPVTGAIAVPNAATPKFWVYKC